MAALIALGVAAWAAQLIAYSKGIVSIAQAYYRVRDASQQYREHERQLNLLINIAHGVEQNPALQNADVQYHLDAPLVDVRALQAILCRQAIDSLKRKY
jgi:hypothetical protein